MQITNEIKACMDDKDHLQEILLDSKSIIDERQRKLDQFQDDLKKIDKAIKRRLENIERIDEDLRIGNQRLQEIL